jgi:NAD(P)-dependent dehydrogenase (short-subunit alcohol dehydrogenase family)
MPKPAEYLESLFGLTGQVAVVIGGTGVLGGALAEGLLQAGAKVMIAGREPDRGARRAEEMAALGDAAFQLIEVGSRASIEELLQATLTRFGRVDMLINGAGINAASTYFEATDDEWVRVLETNLTAVHVGCQVFGKHMSEHGGGSILNIGSATAHTPLSRVFAYSASKAAVVNLTKNVARELAPYNVRVNTLCPGFFPAEQNRAILDSVRVENIMRNTPMARFGAPEELFGATLLLLSRKAGAFITGAEFYVDGGFTAMRF